MKGIIKRLLLNMQRSSLLGFRARNRCLRLLGLDVDPRARIGQDVFFGAGGQVRIGRDSFVGHGGFFDGNARIEIGEAVRIGPYVRLLTGTHEIAPAVLRNDFAVANIRQPIRIERGCWLGMNVSIMPGVVVREGCVIGANALVTSSTEPNGLYVGVPARRTRDLPTDRDVTPSDA
jgi:maltose O-acetyltransferase